MINPHEHLNQLLQRAGVSKTIYSWVMPETEAVIDNILGDTNSSLREMFRDAYREAWTQKQDAMHEGFFETWKQWSRPVIEADWNEFPFMYPVNGASEGLREAVQAYGAKARVEGFEPIIHVFLGEYEGFGAYAEAAGIKVQAHSRQDWREALAKIGPHDQFYLSHPSAIDGNVWEDYDSFAQELGRAQPSAQLMLDVTYVGCVGKDFHVKADYPNIPVVFFSLSKPAGAYYHRIGGFLSRNEYKGLFGNKWFKNLMALRVGTEMMQAHGVHDLPRKYQSVQTQATEQANKTLGLDLKVSDVFLLATMPAREDASELETYLTRQTGGENIVRVCLTPTMAHIVNPQINETVRARPHEGLSERSPT